METASRSQIATVASSSTQGPALIRHLRPHWRFELGDRNAVHSNFHTGTPMARALSARLALIPVPGKASTPIGKVASS